MTRACVPDFTLQNARCFLNSSKSNTRRKISERVARCQPIADYLATIRPALAPHDNSLPRAWRAWPRAEWRMAESAWPRVELFPCLFHYFLSHDMRDVLSHG